jgi:hypothetical protein
MSNELTPSQMGIVPGGEQSEGSASASVTASEQTRAMQEVQASILMAMRYPRDEDTCRVAILKACERSGLAEEAQYVYPKGGLKVTGPSIRLMEECARHWKHLAYGWKIIQESPKGATVMAFAWDMQANNRTTIEFYVEYTRKAKGVFNRIDDPREQYEHVANMSSRRVRACLQRIIPAHIVDEAIGQCDKTLNASAKVDQKALLDSFGKLGVSKEMIEKRIGHNIDAVTQQEVVNLKKIFTSLRDGFAPLSQYFECNESGPGNSAGGAVSLKPKRTPPKLEPERLPDPPEKPESAQEPAAKQKEELTLDDMK